METPTVAIGCPVRNRGWILPQYLKAMEKVIYPKEKIGFCFVVNDSTDDTMEILQEWKRKRDQDYAFIDIVERNFGAIEDKRVAPVRREIYRHLAKVRNILLDTVAKHDVDYFFSVDSDILVVHDTLQKLIYLKEDICAGLVYNDGRTNRKHPHRAPNIMIYDDRGKLVHFKEYPLNSVFKVDVTGAIYLMSKRAYTTIRYDFHRKGEDIAFCEDAQSKGFTLYCNSDAFCYHMMDRNDYRKREHQVNCKATLG